MTMIANLLSELAQKATGGITHDGEVRAQPLCRSDEETEMIVAVLFARMRVKIANQSSLQFFQNLPRKLRICAVANNFPQQCEWPESLCDRYPATALAVAASLDTAPAVQEAFNWRQSLYHDLGIYTDRAQQFHTVILSGDWDAIIEALTEVERASTQLLKTLLQYVEVIKDLALVCDRVAGLIPAALQEHDADGLPKCAADARSDMRLYGAAVLVRAHEQVDRAGLFVRLARRETDVRDIHEKVSDEVYRVVDLLVQPSPQSPVK